jgi:hypothetical protein
LSWKLTVRRGSEVDRTKFGALAEAIAEARGRLEDARSEGGLPPINALRDFTPGQRVHARLELDGPGLFRSPSGGIDLMGDGSIVVYTGSIRKEPLQADNLDDAFERLERALAR